jgi:hypothetical protein
MTDIVERLRRERESDHLAIEAAAEIERLGALAPIVREQGFEIERLLTLVADLRADAEDACRSLRADNERLQAKIKRYEDEQCAACRAYRESEARRALEPKP